MSRVIISWQGRSEKGYKLTAVTTSDGLEQLDLNVSAHPSFRPCHEMISHPSNHSCQGQRMLKAAKRGSCVEATLLPT